MALLMYFKPWQNADSLPDHKSCPSLIEKELKSTNDSVSKCNTTSTNRQDYNVYSAEEHAQIGKYTAENGSHPGASKQFKKLLKKYVPEPMARRFKEEYFKTLKELSKSTGGSPVVMKVLPIKACRRPLFLKVLI